MCVYEVREKREEERDTHTHTQRSCICCVRIQNSVSKPISVPLLSICCSFSQLPSSSSFFRTR